jgi:hypothetical protein
MRIDRRLTLLGVMLVVLSMTMATQYATTRVTFSYGIVNPSDADIRFIGSDNASDGTGRVLRVTTNGTNPYAQIELGNWMPNSRKNYTAAFAIVNEENLPVNITHVNVSGGSASYMTIWLHGNQSKDVSEEVGDAKVCVLTNGSTIFDSNDCPWRLGQGNGDVSNMNGTTVLTPWDTTANVRYNSTTTVNAINGTSDFIWVEVVIDLPTSAAPADVTGTIYFYFKATTTA